MNSDSRPRRLVYFLSGFGVLLFGMLSEFFLGAFLPSAAMQNLYVHGGILALIILCFVSSLLLMRRSLFGQWRYRYDNIIYLIATVICVVSVIQTILGLQIGHPYLEVGETNPLLMNLLWIFVLPPLNPWTMTILAIGFILTIWINTITLPSIPLVHEEFSKEEVDEKPRSWWKILGGLSRVSVWLGSVFLVILGFLLLGSPSLSLSAAIPLYQPHMWVRLLVGLVSVSLLNSAAFILNQIGDVDTDQLHPKKGHLPVSAGQIKRRTAALLATSFIAIGLMLAYGLGLVFLGIVGFIFIFAIIYSFPPLRLKGRPFLDLLIIGLAFGTWAILTAWGILTIWPISFILAQGPAIPIVLLFGAGFFYSGTHCIHTSSDYYADSKAEIQTTAVYMGPKRATKLGIVLIAVGLLLLYIAVGYFTHLFWYGLLKYKSIFLLIFLGFPFFALFQEFRFWQQSKTVVEAQLRYLQWKGRWVTYLLFLILLVYLLFYIFLFYPIYYPNYFFPWI